MLKKFLVFLTFILLFSCNKNEENPISSDYGKITGQLLFNGKTDSRLNGSRIALYENFSDWENKQISVAVFCDSSGNFAFENLEPGNYYLDAWNDADKDGQLSYYDLFTVYGSGEYPNFQPAPISIEPGKTKQVQLDLGEVENPLPDISGYITVPSGYSSSNVSVQLYNDASLLTLYREVYTNPNGSYVFLDISPGSYYLTAFKDMDNNGKLNVGDLYSKYPNPDSSGYIQILAANNYTFSFSLINWTYNSDIPPDPLNVTPPTPMKNNVQPTASFSAQGERISINLQGLLDPNTQQPINLFYNSSNPSSSNLFVTQNGITKGLLVTKVGTGTTLKADVVFTVDNSGSMGEEADVIAQGIANFANVLASSGLDVQFACVGYDGSVNGSINLTTAANLSAYLNRSGYTGTARTTGFGGNDATILQTNASSFASGIWGENGVVGCLFGYQYFNWRSGASKIFINFTDEPTQPGSGGEYNTAQLCNTLGGIATVHTVFSEDSTYYSGYWSASYERPWNMSKCTGGSVKFVDRYATNLVLTDLPVVGALSNSYLVEYMKGSSTIQEWLVKIIVYTATADGEITYRLSY